VSRRPAEKKANPNLARIGLLIFEREAARAGTWPCTEYLSCVSCSKHQGGRAVLVRSSSLLVSKARRGRRQNRVGKIAQDAPREVHFFWAVRSHARRREGRRFPTLRRRPLHGIPFYIEGQHCDTPSRITAAGKLFKDRLRSVDTGALRRLLAGVLTPAVSSRAIGRLAHISAQHVGELFGARSGLRRRCGAPSFWLQKTNH